MYEKDWETDPVFLLAKPMLDETPTVSQNIDRNELLVEGLIIKLTFTKIKDQSCVDVDTDDERNDEPDIHLRNRSEHCLVTLKGVSKQQEMRLYGYNATEVIEKRSGKEQEFLLLSRVLEIGKPASWSGLMLIDWDADKATKAGVASLRLDNVKLLSCTKPEKRLFTLR